MANVPALQTIEKTIRAPESMGRLMLALGHKDQADDAAVAEAKQYAASVMGELEKIAASGDSKKMVILQCSPQSIVQTMIDAAKFRLMIDGRQHAHLVKYGNECTLQIGYRGYIAKVAEHYENADLNVFPVYEGDVVQISGSDGFDRYTHDRANAFEDSVDKFKGIVAVLYYKKGGREFQKVITMTKNEIGKIRKAAKQDFVWSAWFIEKAKAAAVKRICKLQFASISILQEMIAYDNQKHYDIDKPVDDMRPGSIVDNLNAAMAPETGAGAPESDDVIDGSFTREDTPEPSPAPAAAESGDMFPGDLPSGSVSRETLGEAETKKVVAAIKRSISAEDTEQGMIDLFEVDFKDDIAKVKASSAAAYNHLIEHRDARLAEIRGQA